MTTTMELRHAAARQRRQAVAARADRPRQRRSGEESTAAPRVASRVRDLVLRAAGDSGLLEFRGMATVYERAYEMWDFWGPYTEVVSAGAASETLARADLDVPLVLQHADLRRIARTTNGSLTLTETDDGLDVHAPQLDPADRDVDYIAPKLRSGLVDEMSFRFMITSGHWSPDYTEYRIEKFNIHRGDVAIVGYGANPYTAGSGLRSADPLELVRGLDDAAARAAHQVLAERLHPRSARDLITDEDVRPRVLH